MNLARLAALAGLFVSAGAAACNDGGGVKPSTVVSASDSADQVLYGFVHFLTRNGVREGQVEADTAYFYDPTQTTVLRNMKLVFIDSAGKENATITSKVGTYKWQTGNMLADTNVVMKSHDGRVLKSEQLFYDATKKELTTPLFFTFDKDADHIEGKGFRSDLNFEHVVVNQPVGSAKDGFLLPGQEKADAEEQADSVRRADSTKKAVKK